MIVRAPEMQDDITSRARSNRPHKLFDHLLLERGFTSDAKIAEALETTPAYISRMRSGGQKVGASVILAIYDATDMTIEQIRELI